MEFTSTIAAIKAQRLHPISRAVGIDGGTPALEGLLQCAGIAVNPATRYRIRKAILENDYDSWNREASDPFKIVKWRAVDIKAWRHVQARISEGDQ